NADSIHRDPGRAWVGFVGKGAKYAEIDLDYPTLTGIDRHLAGRTEGPLFLNEWGNRFTRENVQTVLDRYIDQCKIGYHVSPHAPSGGRSPGSACGGIGIPASSNPSLAPVTAPPCTASTTCDTPKNTLKGIARAQGVTSNRAS